MKDENVNWVPGMDHAGIATQALFDKELKRNGESKEEIGREMYVDMVGIEMVLRAKLAEWSQTSRHRIREQLKSMGGLLNWSEEVRL